MAAGQWQGVLGEKEGVSGRVCTYVFTKSTSRREW